MVVRCVHPHAHDVPPDHNADNRMGGFVKGAYAVVRAFLPLPAKRLHGFAPASSSSPRLITVTSRVGNSTVIVGLSAAVPPLALCDLAPATAGRDASHAFTSAATKPTRFGPSCRRCGNRCWRHQRQSVVRSMLSKRVTSATDRIDAPASSPTSTRERDGRDARCRFSGCILDFGMDPPKSRRSRRNPFATVCWRVLCRAQNAQKTGLGTNTKLAYHGLQRHESPCEREHRGGRLLAA